MEEKHCQKCGSPINGDQMGTLCDSCAKEMKNKKQNGVFDYFKHHKWIGICIAAVVLYGTVIVPTVLNTNSIGTKILSSLLPTSTQKKNYYEMALAEYNSGNYEDAYRYIQKTDNPNDPNVIELRNQILPKQIESLYAKAVIKKDEGDFAASYDLLLKILDLNPGHEKANALREEITPQAIEQKEQKKQEQAERSKSKQEEKNAKISSLIAGNHFDGELAAAILKLDDPSNYYTYKYSANRLSDGSGAYYEVSKWSQLGYSTTYKVYADGHTELIAAFPEKDAKKHIEAKGVLDVKEAPAPTQEQEPENTPAPQEPSANPSSNQSAPKTDTSYQPQFESSIGYITLANGTKVEYFHESPEVLCNDMEEFTSSQLDAFYNYYAGQYVIFTGEIYNATSDGVITVYCIDEQESRERGLLWPLAAYAELHLDTSVYNIAAFSKGTTITAMGQIYDNCYSSILGVPTLKLDQGIVLR